jgi:hypothetical protein
MKFGLLSEAGLGQLSNTLNPSSLNTQVVYDVKYYDYLLLIVLFKLAVNLPFIIY